METALKTPCFLLVTLVCQLLLPVSGDLLFEARESRLCSYEKDQDGNIGEASCFLENLSFTVGVEVDVEDRILFFSDINEGTIRRVNIADGVQQVETVFHGLGSVEDIAVDWVAKNMYWTDFVLGHISVSRYDGSRRNILITDQPGPRSIAVHPQKAILFWTNVEDTLTAGNIMRSNLACTNPRVLVGDGLSSPNGLAIDFDSNQLFFADRGTEMIEWVRLGGGQRTQIYAEPNSDFFDMTIFGDFLYTTRWGSSSPNGHVTAVEYPEPNESAFVPTVIEVDEHEGKALGIATFDESRQPPHGVGGLGQCGASNGGCDHLCLPTTGSEFDCDCATGFALADDGLTCETDVTDEEFLLFIDSSLSTIFQAHLNSTGFPVLSAVDLMEEVDYPVDLAFDPVEGKVYWTDRSTKTVSRSRLDGSEFQIVAARNVEDPSGIDLDVLRRQVYWVDEDTKTINVINMDLTGQKVIVTDDLDEPRAIAVNPISGEIFWTDWGSQAKIEKANLDGSDRQTIISSEVGWPNGIAIDVEKKELFWCDAQHDLIETCDFDGNNRRVAAYLEDTAQPIGLTVTKSHIYWLDWTTRSVFGIDRGDNSEIRLTESMEDEFLRLQGMALSTVSYPLDATISTAAPPAPVTEDNSEPGDPGDNDASAAADSLVIIIAAGVGGGILLIAIIIVLVFICCKCRRNSKPSQLEARAAENHAMDNMPAPFKAAAAVALPPRNNSKGGDHIYEDLDGLQAGLNFDADQYLNPAFVKGEQNNSQYTGLNLKGGPPPGPVASVRETYETPSPTLAPKKQPSGYYLDRNTKPAQNRNSDQSAYYLDLNQGPGPNLTRNDSMGSYTDLRNHSPQQNRTPKSSVSSISGGWPPQQSPHQTSERAPRPPASPRPSQTSMTSNWPPMEQSRSPRISATRPPPSPRFSQTGPPSRSPRLSTTQGPPATDSTYFSSLGVPPSAPNSHYEVSMNMR